MPAVAFQVAKRNNKNFAMGVASGEWMTLGCCGLGVLVLTAVFAAYSKRFHNDLHFDDGDAIVRNRGFAIRP